MTKQQVEKPLLSSTGRIITNFSTTNSQFEGKNEPEKQGDIFASSGIELYSKTVGALKKSSAANTNLIEQPDLKNTTQTSFNSNPAENRMFLFHLM